MGPLLFIVYVNDLSLLKLKSKVLQYADDTVLYVEGDDAKIISNVLQSDLNTLVDYCDINQLTINADKTKLMLYTYENDLNLEPVQVHGKPLELVKNYKYLGINLDRTLSFKKELNIAISRINHKIWMLNHFTIFLEAVWMKKLL